MKALTDKELARALDLSELELAEAFGYNDSNDLYYGQEELVENSGHHIMVVENLFQEEDYALDTLGLQLMEDVEPSKVPSFDNTILLAASHGYYDLRADSSMDNVELAAQFGYCSGGADAEVESSTSDDDLNTGYSSHGGGNSEYDSSSSSSCDGSLSEEGSSVSSSCNGSSPVDDSHSSSNDDGSSQSESLSEGS